MTSLNPVYTVGFQISEALILHQRLDQKQSPGTCAELLNLVGIPDADAALG